MEWWSFPLPHNLHNQFQVLYIPIIYLTGYLNINLQECYVLLFFPFDRLTISQKDAGKLVLSCSSEGQQLHITANPFEIQLVSKDEIVLSMNTNGLLYFEHLQHPPQIRCGISISGCSPWNEINLGYDHKYSEYNSIEIRGTWQI